MTTQVAKILSREPMDQSDRSPDIAAAPIAILGVPLDRVTTTQTIALIGEMIASGRSHYIVTPNVDFLVQASRDVELRRILFEAHLVLCDGTPLLWASWLLGNRLPERVAGSDLVPLLIRTAAERGYRLFFLGGAPGTTELAIARLRSQYPDLRVVDHYSPPFAHLLDMDHEQIRQRIHNARPDILFVAFGCPKQEKWIAMHYRSLGVPVSIGVGGTVDFLAGKLARAPVWMRRLGLEWVFRLIQEPRRLGGRYAKDLFGFAGPVLAQWWRLQFSLRKGRSPAAENDAELETDCPLCQLPEHLDAQSVEEGMLRWENLLANNRRCFFDLSKVRFIDSTGVGALIQLQKRARVAAREVAFLAPSSAVRRALSEMQLDGFFDFATDIEMAERHFGAAVQEPSALVKEDKRSRRRSLVWQGEIMAANAEQVWQITEPYIRCQAVWQQDLTIELGSVRFIDTTGLAVMVRAKREAIRAGATLRFANPPPEVRNVIRIARLEEYLLAAAS